MTVPNFSQIGLPHRGTRTTAAPDGAWSTPEGQVNFRPDIYNHDGAATLATSAY